jgi:hypothetical protein
MTGAAAYALARADVDATTVAAGSVAGAHNEDTR